MLIATQFSGFGARRGGAALSYAFQGSQASNSSATVYTFSSASFGVAATDRIVIVAAGGLRSTASTGSVSSITAGGTTLTNIQSTSFGLNNKSSLSLRAAVVSTGTSGDIVVTFNGVQNYCFIGWWVASGLSSTTASDSVITTNSGTSISTSAVTVPSGGFGVFACNCADNNQTWTNAVELAEQTQSSGSRTLGLAEINPGTGATPTVTCASPTSSNNALVGASWS